MPVPVACAGGAGVPVVLWWIGAPVPVRGCSGVRLWWCAYGLVACGAPVGFGVPVVVVWWPVVACAGVRLCCGFLVVWRACSAPVLWFFGVF